MSSVAIVGAGIAGLMTAYRLHAHGFDVRVFESGAQAGGVIRSARHGGYLVEHGPNSIQARTRLVEDVVAELGLGDALVEASPAAKKRFIVRGGQPVPMPGSPPAFVRSRLFSARAKLGLLGEPFVRPAPPDAEETVADFVRRRLGREWLDYAINPFVAGVYAGDPERLAIRHAFPRLHAIEQEYGSLIRGQIRKSRAQKRLVEAAPSGRMFSFREGLQALPTALAAQLGERVHYHTTVTALRPMDVRWRVTTHGPDGEEERPFDRVVCTVPLHRLARLRLGLEDDLTPLRDVWYPPVRVVALGYPRAAVRHPLDGFGMLVPAVELDVRILGALFSSTLFPRRAPEGHVLLTVFVGGARHPDLARLPEAEVQAVVEDDLRRLLGTEGTPDFAHHVYWEHAIPQYEVGYGTVKGLIDRIERTHPGFYMTGNYRQGISVADTLAAADETARRIADDRG